MDYPLDFQKICLIDSRKVVLLMITVAAFVIIYQFLSIPYGGVLFSIFPSAKVPLVKHLAQDTFPIPQVNYSIPTLNNSLPSSSSGSPMVANEEDQHIGMEDDGSALDEDFDLETQFSSVDAIDPNRNSTIITFEDMQNTSISDMEQSEDSSSSSVAPAVPPEASVLTKVDADISPSPVSSTSNVSPVGEQTTHTLSEDNQSTTKGTSNNSSMTSTNSTTERDNLGLPGIPITSISEMNLLLHKSRASSHSMIPRWSSARDQEILLAKSQIENPPIVKKDRDLYAPLYRNISMFKRSYELMEQTLKVYIYKEGAKPIFHQPETKGIYASEGWFMKQMEGNRHYSVKDPRKAHLFYLPFSSRRLEEFLYVPNSHSHKNLVEYLKNYLEMISSKYPYWSRTDGSDHFLVACHDWAPSETKRSHMSNSIRALCNADINEGFVMGKDVSLPETNVRQAKDPIRDIGGQPGYKRTTLAFFAGSMHGYVRPILLNHWENKDPDMKIFSHLGRGSKSRTSYVQYMKNSKYCICAKGYEVNSPRVVEAIFYECVPVIISDNFVPPFFEVLKWEEFAVFVKEEDIPNLKKILVEISDERYLKLQMRVKKVQRHFLWHPKAAKYDIFHMILHSVWLNRVFQINLG